MRSDAAAPERRVNLDRSPNGRRRCLCCTEQMVELLESLARVVRQSRALGQVLVGMFFCGVSGVGVLVNFRMR